MPSCQSDVARISIDFVYGLSFRRKRSFNILCFWGALLKNLFGANFDYEVEVVVGNF